MIKKANKTLKNKKKHCKKIFKNLKKLKMNF